METWFIWFCPFPYIWIYPPVQKSNPCHRWCSEKCIKKRDLQGKSGGVVRPKNEVWSKDSPRPNSPWYAHPEFPKFNHERLLLIIFFEIARISCFEVPEPRRIANNSKSDKNSAPFLWSFSLGRPASGMSNIRFAILYPLSLRYSKYLACARFVFFSKYQPVSIDLIPESTIPNQAIHFGWYLKSWRKPMKKKKIIRTLLWKFVCP